MNPVFTTHIDGLGSSESEAILAFHYRHCKRPEFQSRVRYRAGDLTM